VILDVGCGDGRVLVTMAKVLGCRGIGIDISQVCGSLHRDHPSEICGTAPLLVALSTNTDGVYCWSETENSRLLQELGHTVNADRYRTVGRTHSSLLLLGKRRIV